MRWPHMVVDHAWVKLNLHDDRVYSTEHSHRLTMMYEEIAGMIEEQEIKIVHVAGTSHEPFASRVKELKNSTSADHTVELIHDNNTPFDDYAIQVVISGVGHIGYIPKKLKCKVDGWKPYTYNITVHDGYHRVELLLVKSG